MELLGPIGTQLLLYVRQGNLVEFKRMLHGFGDSILHKKDENGMCVLHHAALLGQASIVEHIIEDQTFPVDQLCDRGWTPASFAASSSHLRVLELLIHRGANAGTCLSQVLDVAKPDIIDYLCDIVSSRTEPEVFVPPQNEVKDDQEKDKPFLMEERKAKVEDEVLTSQKEYANMLIERIEEMEKEMEHWLKKTQELEERLNCIICFENASDTVFLPCAHSVACTTCAEMIRKKNNKCPACEKDIQQTIRIYRL
eukprot:TRINITY_DN3629_c0_g1_i1.p1 TRINITY_DN3629_c0_g1~~TRINITY_DN3629_c0_g1_i1.p1  ORF type:complete len:279 (+),score=35.60 TRINITY_DN3629_c0_g1_i1:76-837(+)